MSKAPIENSSPPAYIHENNYSYKKKGVKHRHKEKIIDGERGMTFMFLKKVGDDNKKFYKIYGKETGKGKWTINEIKGENGILIMFTKITRSWILRFPS